jgi:alanine racemase
MRAMDRRAFLQTTAAAAVAPFVQMPRDSSFDPWLEIAPRHIAANVVEVARLNENRPILAVIKNNGYGLGVVPVARILASLPQVAGFAVIKLQEALALRDAGVTAPVLLMGPADEVELAEMVARDIMSMVYTPIGDVLTRVSRKVKGPVHVHVKIDTGLGRVGVPHREATALVRDLAGRPDVVIAGTMMTFSEDLEFDREQLRRFDMLAAEWKQSGLQVGRRHAASSYTFFQHADVALDMVRPGMALFGVYPEPAFRKLQRLSLTPAAALRVRVALVKRLLAGESAGYNRAYVAKRDTWVATLPVGHADGWPRVAAKGARVRINDRLYPVIASVSASHTIVEVGPEPSVKIGDVATLWDWQDGSRPEDVASSCGASVYDLLMHLSALLPRRVVG